MLLSRDIRNRKYSRKVEYKKFCFCSSRATPITIHLDMYVQLQGIGNLHKLQRHARQINIPTHLFTIFSF